MYKSVSFWLFLGILGSGTSVWAQQDLPLATQGVASSRSLPGASPGGTVDPSRGVPALPGTRTPADDWRELLNMSPAAREKALADRSEHRRKYLEERLREYQALSLGERETKLKQLDLTYHLDSLMRMAPELRPARLDLVSPELRPLVEERLKEWDRLPRSVQESVLQHDAAANYFVRAPGTAAVTGNRAPTPPLPEAGRVGRWSEHFALFVALPAREQRETLKALPPAEREEMEAALSTFAKMPPEQRKICLDSFERFGRMSSEQRDQFLQNAARWRAMSSAERATWRALVGVLTPPGTALPPLPGQQPGAGTVAVSNRAASVPGTN